MPSNSFPNSSTLSQRLNRRKLISSAAAVTVTGATLSLSEDSTAARQAIVTSDLRRFGQVSSNTLTIPVNGDPYRWPFAPAIPNILFNKTLYSALIKYDLDGVTPIPDLAVTWETDDAIVWDFELRDDVQWHDGTPFSAEDVKFTFDAMKDPDVNVTNLGVLITLESTEVTSPNSVRLTFSEPVASLPVGLGYLVFILPRHLLEGVDLNNPTEFLENPIGTGPFKFQEFVSGDHTTVVVNPDYFDEKAKIDSVVFKQVPDLNTQVLQVRTGELDVAYPEVQQLDAVSDLDTVEVVFNTPIQYFFIGFNNRLPIFQDRNVRVALAHAVDRQAIVDVVVQGNATLATGPVHPAIEWAYTDEVATYDYDADLARQLLDDAGWVLGDDGIREKDGERFQFTIYSTSGNNTREQINTALEQYFRDVGVEARLEFLEPNVYDQHQFGFDFECLMHFSQLQPDPDLVNYFGTDGPNNYFGYSSAEVDALLSRGRSTTDQDERAEIYKEIQRVLAEDLPVVFFYYPHEIGVINKRVQNYPPLDYRNATLYFHQITLENPE